MMSHNLDKTRARGARLSVRARLRLFWETYAPVMAPGGLAVGLFVASAWLGLWQWTGDPIRWIALLATIFFLVRSLLRTVALPVPSASDARRRVEQDSGLAHRPLDVLDDRPAISDTAWPAHFSRALDQAQGLKPAKRRPALSAVDPYYLRFGLPIILLALAVYMAGFSFERLRQAITPSWQSPIRASQVTYEAWIDPPAYTGRPPLYFKDTRDIAVPEGSEFVLRIAGTKSAPRPRQIDGWRSRFLTPTRLGAQSFEVREVISKTSRIETRVGFSRESWALTVSPDLPPTVDILEDPEADKRDRLILAYSLSDDFGVEALQLEMVELTDATAAAVELGTAFDGTTVLADIPLPGSAQTEVERASAALDLSKNALAGRKVIGRLVATDGAGQSSVSGPAWFTVPDKIFVEPLAKAVAEQRRLVMAGLKQDYAPVPSPAPEPSDLYKREYIPDMTFDRAPADIQRAALLIEAVTDAPAQVFKDPAVYLGLRHTRSQLRHADEVAELRGVPEDLWKIAIRAEFGILGTALEEMREAESALREGIARRATKREIDTLFDRYNTAVEAYTEELRRKAMEEGNVADGSESGGGQSMGSVDEIQELLKAIEEANAAGDTEGARRALARLAEVLENMQIQLSQGGGGSGDGDPSSGGMSEETKKQLEDLADLTGQQRDLQDETRQAERNEEDGREGELTPEELARRQADIESLLDNIENGLPSGETGDSQTGREDADGEAAGEGSQEGQGGSDDPSENGEATAGGGEEPGSEENGKSGAGGLDPEAFGEGVGRAQRAMRESEEALREGDLRGAREAQAQALEALRDVGEALAEAALAEAGGEDGQPNGGDDPLGRGTDGLANDGNDTADIDSRDNATRSRELREELRRRAAEQQREAEEREYLDRLLERF
jgi:hypothetical protein